MSSWCNRKGERPARSPGLGEPEGGHGFLGPPDLEQQFPLQLAGRLEGDGRAEVHGERGLVLRRLVGGRDGRIQVSLGAGRDAAQDPVPDRQVGGPVGRNGRVDGAVFLERREVAVGACGVASTGATGRVLATPVPCRAKRRSDMLLPTHGRDIALLLIALGGFTLACGDGAVVSPDPSTTDLALDGFWTGEAQQTRFEMSLEHDSVSETLTGVGALIPPAGSQAFRVEGIVDDENDVVTLLLEFSTPSSGTTGATVLVHYRARPFGRDQLQGRLNGGGFDDVLLAIRRTDPRFGF